MSVAADKIEGKLATLMRALRSRNYRLFFTGQLISLIGTWMAQVAMSWLVYQLTGSKILLGTVAFASQIPGFFLGPWVGVLVDRWNLRRTLVVTQVLSMLQAFAVAGLTLSGLIGKGQIIILALCLGIINAFDMPARQSFVVHMVERREDLPNAIALNSTMFNASRLLGPTVASIILVGLKEYLPQYSDNARMGICFLLNGLSFVAVIYALLAMRVKLKDNNGKKTAVLAEFREGCQYAFGSLPIRSLLINMAIISLMGSPYTVLLVVFAQDVLHGGEGTLGMLTAAIGAGALVAGLSLAARKNVLGLGKWISIGAICMGLSLVAFSFSHWLWLSVVLLACCGFSMLTQMASSNTVLQTIVEDDKRGRIMALYGMSFLGMMPLGSLLAGWVAQQTSAQLTVALGGVVCVLSGIFFAFKLPRFHAHVRPIYQRQGMIPEVAEGLRASQMEENEKSVSG